VRYRDPESGVLGDWFYWFSFFAELEGKLVAARQRAAGAAPPGNRLQGMQQLFEPAGRYGLIVG